MNVFLKSAAAAALVAFAPLASAQYIELATLPELDDNTGNATFINGTAIVGDTSYQIVIGRDYYRITSISDLGGANTFSEIVSQSAISAVTGSSRAISGVNGIAVVDFNQLQFGEASSDAVYRVDLDTNTMSSYVSNLAIDTLIGFSGPTIVSSQTPLANGELAFYEGDSDSILRTTGPGGVETLISNAELVGLAGNDTVSGLATFGSSLIYGNNSTDSIYLYDFLTDTGIELLDTATIESVTDDIDGRAGFLDLLVGEDGLVYFYENDSDYLLSFDPLDAASTLKVVISEADLNAGPGSDIINQLVWFDEDIAWVTGNSGIYTIPEPSTVALMLIGGLAVICVLARRRR